MVRRTIIFYSFKVNKISKRIQAICDLAQSENNIIYDLCCDHGLIGGELLRRDKNKQITFVDIVPHIMNKVRDIYSYIPTDKNLNFLTEDAKKLQVTKNSQNTYIISGIGASLAVEIFKNIFKQAPDSKFIFCINQKSELLKEYLIFKHQKLMGNCFVYENGQGYEVFMTSINGTKIIPIFDSTIFEVGNFDHHQYLQELKMYYLLKLKFSSCSKFKTYINDLDKILSSFNELNQDSGII